DPYQTTFDGQCGQTVFPGGTRPQYRYRVTGGSFSPVPQDTTNHELNYFLQDNWTIKRLSLNLGVRWTREEIANQQTYQMTSSKTGNPLVASDFGGTSHWVGTRNTDCVDRGDYSAS